MNSALSRCSKGGHGLGNLRHLGFTSSPRNPEVACTQLGFQIRSEGSGIAGAPTSSSEAVPHASTSTSSATGWKTTQIWTLVHLVVAFHGAQIPQNLSATGRSIIRPRWKRVVWSAFSCGTYRTASQNPTRTLTWRGGSLSLYEIRSSVRSSGPTSGSRCADPTTSASRQWNERTSRNRIRTLSSLTSFVEKMSLPDSTTCWPGPRFHSSGLRTVAQSIRRASGRHASTTIERKSAIPREKTSG